METCGRCVSVEDHKKLSRQWNLMCVLCVALLLVVAVLGVKAMEWRADLMETRITLDKANDAAAAKGLADVKELKVKPRKAKKPAYREVTK